MLSRMTLQEKAGQMSTFSIGGMEDLGGLMGNVPREEMQAFMVRLGADDAPEQARLEAAGKLPDCLRPDGGSIGKRGWFRAQCASSRSPVAAARDGTLPGGGGVVRRGGSPARGGASPGPGLRGLAGRRPGPRGRRLAQFAEEVEGPVQRADESPLPPRQPVVGGVGKHVAAHPTNQHPRASFSAGAGRGATVHASESPRPTGRDRLRRGPSHRRPPAAPPSAPAPPGRTAPPR